MGCGGSVGAGRGDGTKVSSAGGTDGVIDATFGNKVGAIDTLGTEVAGCSPCADA